MPGTKTGNRIVAQISRVLSAVRATGMRVTLTTREASNYFRHAGYA
jgi:hypothetical protein